MNIASSDAMLGKHKLNDPEESVMKRQCSRDPIERIDEFKELLKQSASEAGLSCIEEQVEDVVSSGRRRSWFFFSWVYFY